MEKNKLYVGNLSWNTTEDSLQDKFAEAGEVISAKIITDRDTNRSKGFGFVEMASDEAAEKAIELFNGKEVDGREIKVNLAQPKK
ncbi:MAG: RNA-binding protein [Elusimicrobiaceae bacterium]|jgi:RNA recognition motif-containing protein|nr:RNA-binding protein [Elusimicrobiaceae bacterium]MBT3954860.1 RNA-binding protein [Elusimicrobiaceae bacterium]MBT4008393.1 RNA-binding protein [Elusimicrobiaceae bacterium]MBT4402921.1 RNA-binding protein [Elusimicrobiaceae bacterium]MBT4439857.1 RNA-binding protein [Elusimicrobiaceae bacterium]